MFGDPSVCLKGHHYFQKAVCPEGCWYIQRVTSMSGGLSLHRGQFVYLAYCQYVLRAVSTPAGLVVCLRAFIILEGYSYIWGLGRTSNRSSSPCTGRS